MPNYKGIAKGIKTSASYEHSGKGIKKGVFPGILKDGRNIKFVRNLLSFKTNSNTSWTIALFCTSGSSLVIWSFGDGNGAIQSTNTSNVSNTYTENSIKKVSAIVVLSSITGFTNVTVLKIVGLLDLSGFVNCTSFTFNSESGITIIKNPKSKVTVTT